MRKSDAFWNGHWFDLRGKKLHRIRRDEYGELWRLWIKHRDIREGRERQEAA